MQPDEAKDSPTSGTRLNSLSPSSASKPSADPAKAAYVANDKPAHWMWVLIMWLPPWGLMCGTHLCATRRYKQAFLHSSTCGYAGVGWLLDLFRLSRYMKEDRGLDASTAPAGLGLLSQGAVAFFLAWAYGMLLELGWTFTYGSGEVASGNPAELDVRSWVSWNAKVIALILHAVAAATGANVATATSPHLSSSWLSSLGFSCLALALAAADAYPTNISPDGTGGSAYSLPFYAAAGSAIGAIVTLKAKPKPSAPVPARCRGGRTCLIALAVLAWWMLLCVGLVLHGEVAVPAVNVRQPAACKGVRMAGVGAGGEPPWQLPAWHEEEFSRHWAVRCRTLKEGSEAGQETAGMQHSVKVGPLLYANAGRVGKLIASTWNEVTSAVHAAGGWQSFASELISRARDQTGADYATLGLSSGATLAEVKAAYRSLARKLHPDRLRDKSEEEVSAATSKFRKVVEAYERLSASLNEEKGQKSEEEQESTKRTPPRRSRRSPAGSD